MWSLSLQLRHTLHASHLPACYGVMCLLSVPLPSAFCRPAAFLQDFDCLIQTVASRPCRTVATRPSHASCHRSTRHCAYAWYPPATGLSGCAFPLLQATPGCCCHRQDQGDGRLKLEIAQVEYIRVASSLQYVGEPNSLRSRSILLPSSTPLPFHLLHLPFPVVLNKLQQLIQEPACIGCGSPQGPALPASGHTTQPGLHALPLGPSRTWPTSSLVHAVSQAGQLNDNDIVRQRRKHTSFTITICCQYFMYNWHDRPALRLLDFLGFTTGTCASMLSFTGIGSSAAFITDLLSVYMAGQRMSW
jgi:hypothetical protein